MLENWYWIAGIVVAIAAVLGLFIKSKNKTHLQNEQNAKVSGKQNTVTQSSSIDSKGDDEAK